MNIAMWMVILSTDGIDEYYVDLALKGTFENVKSIYIQDQGCTDNTIDIIKEIVGSQTEMVVESVPTGLPRFDRNYNEPYYRSLAIKRCEEIFRPDWLLQQDTDEIFTPFFFQKIKELESSGQLDKYMSVRTATERFITPEYRSQQHHALQVIDGFPHYDPHTRLWRARLGTEYVKNPGVEGFFHCVLRPDPQPTFLIPGICHLHLHRTFGPKAEPFWREGGDEFEDPIILPFSPEKKAPKWFKVQKEEAVYTPFPWPDYVIDRWRRWGEYPGYDWDKNRTEEYKEYYKELNIEGV